MIDRRPVVLSGVLATLATLAVLAGCDAIVGLGTEPDGQTPGGSSSSTTASSAVVSSNVSASAGGGEGGAGATGTGGASATAGSTGAGGGGGGEGGSAPSGWGCGTCDSDFCDACDEARGTCAAARWVVSDTNGVAASADQKFNRFGRGFVVREHVMAFTRHLADGKSVLTVVDRIDGPADASPSLTDGIGAVAANPTGEELAVVGTDNGGDLNIYRLVQGTWPPDLEIALSLGAEDEKFAAIAWRADTRFVGIGRSSSSLYGFDLIGGGSDCLVASSPGGGAGSAIARGTLAGTDQLLVLQFGDGSPGIQVQPAETECNSGETMQRTALGSLTRAYGVSVHDEQVFVAGLRVTDTAPVALRTDAPGDELVTYPGGGIAASALGVFVAHPQGGVRLCPHDFAGLVSIEDCPEAISAGLAGFVTRVDARADSVTTLGVDTEDGTATGQALLACRAF